MTGGDFRHRRRWRLQLHSRLHRHQVHVDVFIIEIQEMRSIPGAAVERGPGRGHALAARGQRTGRALGGADDPRNVPDAGGARAEHDVTEAVLVRDVVDPIDRLKAQRALPAAEVALLEAETQLIQARPVGSTLNTVISRAKKVASTRRGDRI